MVEATTATKKLPKITRTQLKDYTRAIARGLRITAFILQELEDVPKRPRKRAKKRKATKSA